jgi:hypothetical protein
VNIPAENSEPGQDDTSREVLLSEYEGYDNALSSPPPPQHAVLFCPLSGHVHHSKWWLTMYATDHVDIFHL